MPPSITPPATIDLPASADAVAIRHLDTMLVALQDALRLPPRWSPALQSCLDRAFDAYDAYIAHVVAAHPMSCRRGCTACCHDNPEGVSGVELRRLRERIDTFPDAEAIYAAFARLAAMSTDPFSWRAARHPCPLLGEDGACRAYDRRPIACRAFHALSPAAWCDPDSPDYIGRINPHLDPPDVLLLFFKALSERLGLGPARDLHSGLGIR